MRILILLIGLAAASAWAQLPAPGQGTPGATSGAALPTTTDLLCGDNGGGATPCGIAPANVPTQAANGNSGGFPYFSSANKALQSTATIPVNSLVIGGGAGAPPTSIVPGTGVLNLLQTFSLGNLATALGTGVLTYADPYLTDGTNYYVTSPSLLLVTPPPTSGWTFDSGTGVTVSTTGGAVELSRTSTGTSALHAYYRTAPATPYTIKACYALNSGFNNFSGAFLGWRENSSGKVEAYQALFNSGMGFTWENWTTTSSFSASVGASGAMSAYGIGSAVICMAIIDDGTNRKVALSRDGTNYQTITSKTRTTFMTPDQVVFGLRDAGTSGLVTSAKLLHWKVE